MTHHRVNGFGMLLNEAPDRCETFGDPRSSVQKLSCAQKWLYVAFNQGMSERCKSFFCLAEQRKVSCFHDLKILRSGDANTISRSGRSCGRQMARIGIISVVSGSYRKHRFCVFSRLSKTPKCSQGIGKPERRREYSGSLLSASDR